MTGGHTIESHDKHLAALLTDFYVVPSYQREYVWEEEQINQLLSDAYDEYAARTLGSPASEYFIGSIVVCDRPDHRLDLIDGQQRMTTLVLLLCAVRDHLRGANASVPSSLDGLIGASTTDSDGNDVHHYRLELQYDDSGGVLERIAGGEDPASGSAPATRSIENIRAAYDAARNFLRSRFDDPAGVRRFFAYVTQNVKLIRIKTGGVQHALRIFETINDRGKGLDAMDLLKNLLFMQVRLDQFPALNARWKRLVDTVHGAPEKPLRFLRYFVLGTYGAPEKLREDEVYGWFRANETAVGYTREPLAFVDRLCEAATAYARFARGEDPRGAPNRYLRNIARLSGSARQHFVLLLAGRHLPSDAFTELCRQVENLLFTYVITREHTKAFERVFVQWAAELRQVTTRAALDALAARHFAPAKRGLSTRFDLQLGELDVTSLQVGRRRYLLAKLTQHVDEQAFGTEGAHTDLDTYLNRNVDVEHVLPQTLTAEVLTEFGGGADAARGLLNRLGNVVLAEKPINTSLGNKPYSKKRDVYPQSQFLLTRTLSAPVAVGINSTVNRAVQGFTPFPAWTAQAIAERHRMLAALARRVWDIPDDGGPPPVGAAA